MGTIAVGKDQVIWLKVQSAKGTPAWPSATDAVLVTGDAVFSQGPNFLDDPQKQLTLGKTGRLLGRNKAGEFTFPCFIKASGSLGVVPVPAPALKSLMGKETIVGSTSVLYEQYLIGEAPVYLTALVKNNFETWLVTDLVVKTGVIKIVASEGVDAFVSGDFSGGFLNSIVAGSDATAQLEAINATAIHVVDARKFEVSQKIVVGTSGVAAGHLIESVVVATNIVTIAATGLDSQQASGVVVKGWYPAATIAGELMRGYFGKYQEQLGGGSFTDVIILQATVNIDNGWKILNDEKTDTDAASDFAPGDRVVSYTFDRYMRSDGTVYRYEARNQTPKSVKLPAAVGTYSTSAGKRMLITMANAQYDPAKNSGDAERKYALTGYAFETPALNDAIKILFN